MPINNLSEFQTKYRQFKNQGNTMTQQDLIDLRDYILKNPSIQDDIGIERDFSTISRLAERTDLPQRPQIPISPLTPAPIAPPQTVQTIFGPIEVPSGQQIPTQAGLLPREEAIPFSEVAQKEQESAELARRRFLEEQDLANQLFGEASAQEQAERESARRIFLKESEAALPSTVQRYQELFAPALERSLRQSREALGGLRGIGTGGFEGSGALQELAKRSSQELTERATSAALEQLLGSRQRYGELGLEAAQVPSLFRREKLGRQLGGRDLFSQLGLEAAQIPSIYRRAGLERGLESRDIAGERALERELAQLGAQSTIGAARAQGRSSRARGLGSAVGGLAGAYFGGPGGRFLGGYLGSQIGGGLGGLFGG